MKKYLLVVLLFFVTSLFAESDGSIISSFYVPDTPGNNLPAIANKFEIVRKKDDGYVVYVQRFMLDEFYELSLNSRMIEYDISEELNNNSRSGRYASYHKFDEINELLHEFAENYSNFISLEQYGETKQGRPLYALKVSDNVELDEDEPELLITSATHGDELITVEVLLALLQELIDGYGNNERLTSMINDHELYFVLVVSPDGFIKRKRYANRIDPNRDYPYPWRPDKKSGPTIANLINFYNSKDFSGTMDFHAFGGMIMFPWAYEKIRVESDQDFETFDKLTTDMARENGYRHGSIAEVIYIARGCSSDYYYMKNGAIALGIEIGMSKMPVSSKIPGVVDDSREMLWTFIDHF